MILKGRSMTSTIYSGHNFLRDRLLARISQHDSSSWIDGPTLCCELRGLMAKAFMWRLPMWSLQLV